MEVQGCRFPSLWATPRLTLTAGLAWCWDHDQCRDHVLTQITLGAPCWRRRRRKQPEW